MGSGDATVVDLFAAAVEANPGGTAVEAGGRALTYAELDARSTEVARGLRAIGVGPGGRVGVQLGRSVDLSVALLGVLKAGGACVPLDPAYPPSRLAAMVEDANPVVVLTTTSLQATSPAPLARPSAEDVAYVIYTSGSTGVPKGVLLTHRGLVSHHRAVVDLYGLGPGDRVLQFCALGFDASIEEMFPSWAAGATVVHRPDDLPLLGRAWLSWLRDQRITVLNLPTAYWHAWVRDLGRSGQRVPKDIRLVVVGGEKALGPAYGTWRRVAGDRSRWINAYGPTETTCMSTFYEAPAGDDDRDPPIGRPLPGTTVVVVDEALRPVRAGRTGELLIGGPGLARGYLNDPELTARRFVELGVGDASPARMYRTGDLVRQRDGGVLEYVGRADEQVKVQGFRVECGEVEAALARHPAVAACAVVARDDPPGERRLVAFVVAEEPVQGADLRRFLADRLPSHAVPAAFSFLETLPLTDHGKVDRAALAVVPMAAVAPVVDRPPRSPAEERMAVIWAAVLGVPAAGIRPADDFFDLGGHSLLATQVIAQVRDGFGTQTPLRVIFESPTLAGLTAAVEAEAGGSVVREALVAVPRPAGVRFPLSLAQEQMWVLEQGAQPPGLYNFTVLHRFEGSVDELALRRALASVVDRHEILRTGIVVDHGRPQQFTVENAEIELVVVEVSGEADLKRRVAESEGVPFDMARPPLVRVALLVDDGRPPTLAATFDHVISDGTGAGIFLRELIDAYQGKPAPPPPAVQFGDFAVWQRATVGEDVLRRQLDWWAAYLQGMPLGPALPFDHLPSAPTRRIESRALAVPAATRSGLEAVARATDSSVFVVAVAAVSAVLGRAGGETDVVLSTTVSGRRRTELEGLIGTFSGMSRIRTDVSGDPTSAELVARARDRVLGIFDHQDVPFLRVRRAALPDFPTGPLQVAAALPVDLQYFHTRGERPVEFVFRGQLHPLAVTLLDDGTTLTGDVSFKVDFYDPPTVERLVADLQAAFDAIAADPSMRLSQLPRTGGG